MKKSITIFIALVCSIGFAQKPVKIVRESKAYTSLKSYKELYGDDFTKKDSLNIIIRENDTLVLLPKIYSPEGVSIPYEPKDSTFLEIYKDVVYRKYAPIEQKRKYYMRLWIKPIKIFFDQSLDEYYKDVITTLALKINKEVDSLDISFVSKLEESNYIVYQIDKKNSYKYSKNIKFNEHISYYSLWNKSKIYDTKLEINVIKYKNKRTNANYVMQNFIKSLGYFNSTSKLPCRNIFSNCNSNKKQFTREDLEILKYHYSYGICKFTDLATFEVNHKIAKETFSKTGMHLRFIHKY